MIDNNNTEDNDEKEDNDSSLLNVDDNKFKSKEQRKTEIRRSNVRAKLNLDVYSKQCNTARKAIKAHSKFNVKKVEVDSLNSLDYQKIVNKNNEITEQAMRYEKKTKQLDIMNKEK